MARSRRSRFTIGRSGEPYYRSNDPESLPRSVDADLDFTVTPPRVLVVSSGGVPARSRPRVFQVPGGSRDPLVSRNALLRESSVSRVRRSIKRANFPPAKLRFAIPEKVKVCVRRQERREVLFARNIAGRGGGRHGPYRRSASSYYSCKG